MIFHECIIHPDILRQNGFTDSNMLKLIMLLSSIRSAGMLTQVSPSELSLDSLNFKSEYIREYMELLYKAKRINTSNLPISSIYEEWCKNAKRLDDENAIDLIVVPEIYNNLKFKTLESIDFKKLVEITQWSLGKSFKQTEDEMKKKLSPILHYAKEVVIIDPWCNLTLEHYQKSLKIIAEQYMKPSNTECKEDITIHAKWVTTGKEYTFTTTEEYKSGIKEFCQNIKNEHGVSIKVFLWSNNSEKDKEFFWHDRSLITNQCAFGIGDGINIQNEKNLKDSTWSILSDEEEKKRRDIFSETKAIRKAKLELYYDGESWKEAKELNRKHIKRKQF